MGLRWIWVLPAVGALLAAEYSAPAGIRPAIRRPEGPSIIPGGRIVAPAGRQFETGPGARGIAIAPDGRTVASCNIASGRFSLTVLERDREGNWGVRHLDGPPQGAAGPPSADRLVFGGIAFSGEHSVYAAEGDSGLVRLIDIASGERKKTYDLNGNGFTGSYAGDLAFNAAAGVLYVLDPAHTRIVSIDTRRREIASSLAFRSAPSAVALDPGGRKAYVALESSLCVLDLRDPLAPALGAEIAAGSPLGVLAAGGHIFVSNAREDSITVIDAATNAVSREIEIRIPGFEKLRGILPAAMAYDGASGRLLVAEAGINALGVLDVRRGRVLGHIPAAWLPTRVALDRGAVYVANAHGQGAGPSDRIATGAFAGTWERGSVSVFSVPNDAEIATGTATVMEANGFEARPGAAPAYPRAIRRVVLIVKDGRTFDEVFGDIEEAVNGKVVGMPELARFGRLGFAYGGRDRLSVKDVNVTPNHHAMAARWCFSDNFYAAPDLRLEPVWNHLERSGISFRAFGEDSKLADRERATAFIAELEAKYVRGGQPLPRFLSLRLPGDRASEPRPGYPFEASYVAENDEALGRVVAYLSRSPWWRETAVFVTEARTGGGADHVDARRTLLLGIGPHMKRGYVSHVHAGFPSLLKTVFALLGAPPMSLFDAAASDLRDCFTGHAEYSPYETKAEDRRLR